MKRARSFFTFWQQVLGASALAASAPRLTSPSWCLAGEPRPSTPSVPILEAVGLGRALWAASTAPPPSDKESAGERSHRGQQGGLGLGLLAPGQAPSLSGPGRPGDAPGSGGLGRVLTQSPRLTPSPPTLGQAPLLLTFLNHFPYVQFQLSGPPWVLSKSGWT